jgi:hypothetical protein
MDNVDVDVDVVVDLVVDTAGHPLATDVSRHGLGSALGTSGASYLQSLGRVHVHVHVAWTSSWTWSWTPPATP